LRVCAFGFAPHAFAWLGKPPGGPTACADCIPVPIAIPIAPMVAMAIKRIIATVFVCIIACYFVLLYKNIV
jgi:hypothetical protein